MIKERLSAVGASFERLSGREQLMVLFVFFGLAGMITGLTAHFVRKDLELRSFRIEAKNEQLTKLIALRTDYQRRLAEQNRLADSIRSNNDMRLLSYLEDISKKANIELGNAAERQGEPLGSDVLKEEAAEVTIRNVSIDRLFSFLKLIEEGNNLVRVRRLKIKTRFDNPKMLDATVTVGTFKTSEQGA